MYYSLRSDSFLQHLLPPLASRFRYLREVMYVYVCICKCIYIILYERYMYINRFSLTVSSERLISLRRCRAPSISAR